MDFVNFVKYKVYMSNKNSNTAPENKHQITKKEDMYNYSETGVYLRDDHCDWGSSGMSEYSDEYPLHIISDDK